MAVRNKTLLESTTVTAAQTVTSDWFDVDDEQELIIWLNVTAFAARADETLAVVIHRSADNAAGYTVLHTFTTVNTTGAQSQEKSAASLNGGKIRFTYTTAGTWASKSLTFNIKMQGKRFR